MLASDSESLRDTPLCMLVYARQALKTMIEHENKDNMEKKNTVVQNTSPLCTVQYRQPS